MPISAIAVNTPSIGIKTFPMIQHLYDDLGISDQLVDPLCSYEENLFNCIVNSLDNASIISSNNNIVSSLKTDTLSF